jgi:hypothetical protein
MRTRSFLFRLAVLCCTLAQGQTPRSEHQIHKGQVVAAIHSASKPEQSYALYVPSNYVPERRWPIVYIFEPRARGSLPVELMKTAAEHYGYLLAASNNSRNGPWEPEREAATEMWNDTHTWLSIDDRRVYFAGLSGGARLSSKLAQLCNCVHGVFLNGAGFWPGEALPPKPAFAVFATAGMGDLNYCELVQLDSQLEGLGYRHFFQRFAGEHEWAPASTWETALAWSSLLEMKDGLRARDDVFVAAELAKVIERMHQREQAQEFAYALGESRGFAAAFLGLADTSVLARDIEVLAKNPAVKAGLKQEKAEIERQHALENDVLAAMQVFKSGSDLQTLTATAQGQTRRLWEDMLNEKRPDVHVVLQRAVGDIFIHGLEIGGNMIEQGQYRTAEAYLSVAAEARPDRPWVFLSLAKCHAAMGDRKTALRDLKRATETGYSAKQLTEFVKSDPKLAPLADAAEFQKLLASIPEKK